MVFEISNSNHKYLNNQTGLWFLTGLKGYNYDLDYIMS